MNFDYVTFTWLIGWLLDIREIEKIECSHKVTLEGTSS